VESHKILFESLDKAEKHFEAGEIKLAQKLVNDVSRSIKSAGKISNKLKHRFNFMSAQSRYFNDISSFAANPKRDEIIKEIETLISKPNESPKKQANEIHKLQTKWQLLDHSSKPASRNQWIKFKTLTDKAWEPCAQYYDELKAVKILNADERKKIINNLLQYTETNNSKWPEIIEMNKYMNKIFKSWQSFAPVLDEDFTNLKIAYQEAKKPINEAIRDQEKKNYKSKEALIEKVIQINDENNQTCIQKFKKIKHEYQNIGPAGRNNEPKLWKKLNAAADRFFEAEKALANEELSIIVNLLDKIKQENCSINKIKDQVKTLNKTKNFSEFKKLQKAIKVYETKQSDAINANKIKTYQDLLSYLNTNEENNPIINKDIFNALKKPQYIGNKEMLLESVVKLELIAKIDPPTSDKSLKQRLSLEMLQNKFSGKNNTNEEIKDLLIKFINNLQSNKTNAQENKLWKRVNEVLAKIPNQLP